MPKDKPLCLFVFCDEGTEEYFSSSKSSLQVWGKGVDEIEIYDYQEITVTKVWVPKLAPGEIEK